MEKKYFKRDLSWLSFNERVLQEAEDTSNSLNERLSFLAIFSSNLDEFYRVRVSKLREFRRYQKDSQIRLKEKPKKVIKSIQLKVNLLQSRFGKIYKTKLLPELKSKGIELLELKHFSSSNLSFAKTYFNETVSKHIKLFYLNSEFNLDEIKDKGLYFFVNKEEPILIEIPSDELSRFVQFPTENNTTKITFLDEIIRANIHSILPYIDAKDIFSVKITRDGELYYQEEDGELLQLIKNSLKERDQGLPTRVLYDTKIPKSDLKVLRRALNLKKTDLMPGGKFHNFSDFFSFPKIEEHLKTLTQPQLNYNALNDASSVIKAIESKDELLCFPYHKYDAVIKLLDEASTNPLITNINITLYRVSKTSLVANALLKCLANNKKVTVFMETKARFDEENNIYWGEKLAKLGANVLYSMPHLKVHSKVLLIESSEKDIAYIGTGNFNEKSSKIYTDFSLITSDFEITRDLKEVFNYLNNTDHKPKLSKILMSPFTTRKSLYDLIDIEIEKVKSGKEGVLFFKMNSLEDKGIIDKLYEASSEGVKIDLIVRGICCLIPGVKGMSDNITIKSIVGKYLEHSRIYAFGSIENRTYYIGSADCMERNLDKRVEVIVPIQDKKIKSILEACLDLQWHDNTKARLIDEKQSNTYQKVGKSKINAQIDFYEYLEALNL